MRKLFSAALAVMFSAVTALASGGGIPNAPEGADAVLIDGLWYWLFTSGVLTLIT
jgi:hypothetical protein